MAESFFLVALALCIVFICRVLMGLKRRIPPSPTSLPIVGHLYILKRPLHETLKVLSSRYGPVLYLRFGSLPAVIVSSPSAIEECFTKNDVVLANRPRTLAGDHLSYGYTAVGFAPYGHTWRTLRRLMVVESFSAHRVQELAASREEEVVRLCRRLFHLSANGPQKFNLKYLFSLLTANIILRVVAGRPVSEQSRLKAEADEEERLLANFKERFYPTMSMTICDFVPIFRWIGYKGLEKSMIRMRGMRDQYLQRLIDEVRLRHGRSNEINQTNQHKSSMIESLLSLQDSHPEFYSDDIIKSVILVMFTAGADTTALTLEWAMSLLLSNPEALRKLRLEIHANIRQNRMLKDSDLRNLPYLRCVVNETLRLYPATPLLLPHSSSQECTIKGYKVPRGTMILLNAWAVHRDPSEWEDAEKFKPERFEGVTGDRDGFRFIPFGAGRRACLGALMGLRTVSLALGALVQCFEWEAEEIDMSQAVGLTLSKAKPLEAVCRPRHSQCEAIFGQQ